MNLKDYQVKALEHLKPGYVSEIGKIKSLPRVVKVPTGEIRNLQGRWRNQRTHKRFFRHFLKAIRARKFSTRIKCSALKRASRVNWWAINMPGRAMTKNTLSTLRLHRKYYNKR